MAVALSQVTKGELAEVGGISVIAQDNIPAGHKIALSHIPEGEKVIKYGFPIGNAEKEIKKGEWVHIHNLKTALSAHAEYSFDPSAKPVDPSENAVFMGYMRSDGRAGVRNELWILPTVGCVNAVAERLARENQHLVGGSIEGLYAYTHPYGCSQLGDDHARTCRILAALAKHPNAGGVLVLGLGCENLSMEQFKEEMGDWDERRVKFLVAQDVEDELETGGRLLKELAEYAADFRRQEISAEKLVVGMKCGGSDGLSGITANPAVGVFSDLLISKGGSTILTEVPEMFGAETILMNRCINRCVFDRAVSMINGFKEYFTRHGQTVYENPSPGNKAGGITTLEDKSLGCVQKGGSAPVSDVLSYGEGVKTQGLSLLCGPGNDLVSTTALAAAGAQIIVFTTGRGTPFGAPVPTVKISSNTRLFCQKPDWIDFNAGTVAEGEAIASAGKRLLDAVLRYAGGEKTTSEKQGYRGIAIFKDGVTL